MARYQTGGSRGKKGNKKHGRNREKCRLYREQGRREKNKARRLAKRLRKYKRNRETLNPKSGV